MTTKTIPLKYPFDFGGKTISEISFRRLKAKDMPLLARLEGLEGEGGKPEGTANEAEAAMLLVEIVTGLPREAVQEIDLMEDFPAVSEAAGDFLAGTAPPVQTDGAA